MMLFSQKLEVTAASQVSRKDHKNCFGKLQQAPKNERDFNMDLDRADKPERIHMARRRGVRGHSDYVREEEVFWREVSR